MEPPEGIKKLFSIQYSGHVNVLLKMAFISSETECSKIMESYKQSKKLHFHSSEAVII